jgi:hypothetical protein
MGGAIDRPLSVREMGDWEALLKGSTLEDPDAEAIGIRIAAGVCLDLKDVP